MLPLGVDIPFNFTSLHTHTHTHTQDLKYDDVSLMTDKRPKSPNQKKIFVLVKIFFNSYYLPISGSLSIFKPFEARDFLSKDFHIDGHEQATVVSVAAGGVNHQEHHQKDHHDDANHAALGHTAGHFVWRERVKMIYGK